MVADRLRSITRFMPTCAPKTALPSPAHRLCPESPKSAASLRSEQDHNALAQQLANGERHVEELEQTAVSKVARRLPRRDELFIRDADSLQLLTGQPAGGGC